MFDSQEDGSEVIDSENESKELNIVEDGAQDSCKETEQKQQSLAKEDLKGIKDKLNVLREAYKLWGVVDSWSIQMWPLAPSIS